MKKCPYCQAVTTLIKQRRHSHYGGMQYWKYCNVCHKDLKSYEPKGGKEVYIPVDRDLHICGAPNCKNAATIFIPVKIGGISKHVTNTELPMCDKCHKRSQEQTEVTQPKVTERVRRIYHCGYCGI